MTSAPPWAVVPMSDICQCAKPEPTEGSWCRKCLGFACVYADRGQAKCPRWRCDCFIDEYPDDPVGLHPEAFTCDPLDGGGSGA